MIDPMPEKQPNLVLVMVDQMRWDCAGFAARDLDGFAAAARTPRLDALAAEGVNFENAYCASPVCSPARASWLTGLLPHAHHQLVNYGPQHRDRFGHRMNPALTTLGDVLKQAGYACGIVGPWHLGDDETPQHGFTDMWDTVKYLDGDLDAYRNYLAQFNLIDAYKADNAYRAMATSGVSFGPTRVPTEHQRTTWTIDRTIDFARRQVEANQPFFAFASVKDPHPPIAPPEGFIAHYDATRMPLPRTFHDDLAGRPGQYRTNRRFCAQAKGEDHCRGMVAHYLALIEHVDAQVGRLIDTLDKISAGDDTLICFISDHGEMMGDHGMMAKGVMLEASVRVPWVMRWPRGLRGGQRVATPVSGLDLAPTLAAFAGAAMPDPVDGRSLAPALRDGSEPGAQPVIAEIATLERLNDHTLDDAALAHTAMIRDGDLKAIFHRDGDAELYDLAADPYEMTNLAPQRGDTLAAMRRTLADRLTATGPDVYSWV